MEGYGEETGFKIGNGEEYGNVDTQDKFDAEAMFNTLQREVIPLFYDRNDNDLPVDWIKKMKASIHMAGQRFSTHRMLMDYTNQFYVPAVKTSLRLQNNNFELNRQLTDWINRISYSWDRITIRDIEILDLKPTVYVGQKVNVRLHVYLDAIAPDDVRVEIVSGRINAQEQLLNFSPISATLENNQGKDGLYIYQAEIECRESGRFGITARIIPKNENLLHTFKPKLISWW
ncbi:MAG: hypothetical protein PHU88_01815 [candidate division Zixibacteria bacterium]|nr:hypothetical protein [candidate division Zixibacteria bacterium]